MNLESEIWRGRRKRVSRRLLHDLRTFLPVFGLLFCFAASATVIVAAEMMPL